MEPVNNITYAINANVFHKYVEFVQDGKKYVACTGNNTGKLYIIDASKELATTTPYTGTTANGIMSMGVVEVSGKAYVVTTCGAAGSGTVYVHKGSGTSWASTVTTSRSDVAIVADSTPFWCESDTDAITFRGGYNTSSTYAVTAQQTFKTLLSTTTIGIDIIWEEYVKVYASAVVYNETHGNLIIAGG